MALHETLHIYMSFHLRKIRQALLHRPVHEDAESQGPACRDFRVVGDRSWPLGRRRARVREREEERFCVLNFSFFFRFFFLSFLHLQRDSGGLRPELLVTRDSCVLRSPAGLKPDKDYHTLEMLYLPAASEGSPFARAGAINIKPLESRDGRGNWHWQRDDRNLIFRITCSRRKRNVYISVH